MKYKILFQVLICFFIVSCVSKKDERSDNTIKKNIYENHKTNDINSSEKSQIKIQDSFLGKKIKDKLVGKIYSSITELIEVKDLYSHGGGIIEGEFNNKNYSLSRIKMSTDAYSYIFLEQIIHESKNDFFKILDILDLTKESKLKDYNLYYHFCYYNNKNDQEIIAIAKYVEDEEFFTDIYKAWRADRKTEKIIEISTEGITVENVGFGI